MTIFDDRVDLWITNTTPGLINVWFRNPDEFFYHYAGVPYDPKLSGIKAQLNTQLGTPPQPPPSQFYGVTGKTYTVLTQFVDTNGQSSGAGNFKGPVKVEMIYISGSGYSQLYNRKVTNGDGVVSELSIGSCQTVNCSGGVPRFTVLEEPAYGNTPPNAGEGYPELTAADIAVVTDFLAGLAAIQYTATGGGGGQQIAQLSTQIAQLTTDVPIIRGGVERGFRDLGPTLAPLPDIQLDIIEIKRKVTDILDCTCAIVLKDCAGNDRTGLKEVLRAMISLLCDIQFQIGFSPLPILVPGTIPRPIFTVKDALADLMRRTGFDNSKLVAKCDEDVFISNLEEAIALVDNTLGYGDGLPTGEIATDGTPIIVCNVVQSFKRIINQPVNITNIDGYERFDQPYPILKLVFSAEDTTRHDHQITLVGVPAPPTPQAIKAAVGSYRVGDWLCRVYLATSRKLEGWYEDKETGWAHLKALAVLSDLPLRLGEDVAIYQPANSPKKWRGKDLKCRSAYWSDSTEGGETPATIRIR